MTDDDCDDLLQPNILDTNTHPPVSIIIPYKCGTIIHSMWIEDEDEVIVVDGEISNGHARIEGVKISTNEWIIQTDADALYPKDYIPNCKRMIQEFGDQYPIMSAKRTGGFRNMFFLPYDHGIIARKDAFMEMVKDYEDFEAIHRNPKFRVDIAPLFQNKGIPMRDIPYAHPLTKGEKAGIQLTGVVAGFAIILGMAVWRK